LWIRFQQTLLSLKLLFCAHRSTWSSSADLELTLAAGITIYVSAAYLNSSNCGEICCIDYIRRWADGRSLHYAGWDVKLSVGGTAEPCTVTVAEEVDDCRRRRVYSWRPFCRAKWNVEQYQRPCWSPAWWPLHTSCTRAVDNLLGRLWFDRHFHI